MNVAAAEWITLLQREYLHSFVADGGAAVKIAVAPPENAPALLNDVTKMAQSEGYCVARVDAAITRVHMIDQIFYEVARQIDWDKAVNHWLRDLLQNNGILVPNEQALQDTEAIALANGRQRHELLQEINRLIDNALVQNYRLNREFRTALAMLCRSVTNPQNVSPSDAELIKQWLCGHKCNLSALHRLQIYQRIGRHNARWLLASLTFWLPQAGYRGLVLLLDLNAVVQERPAEAATVRYTRNTLLDTYEVLRQFIDDTDEMTHLLLIAVAGPGLLDDPRRNVDNYTALKLRIVDEVHDRSRSNPLNAMVRLATVEA